MARSHHEEMLLRGWSVAGPRQSKYEREADGAHLIVWRAWPAGWQWTVHRAGHRERIGGGCQTRLRAAAEAAEAVGVSSGRAPRRRAGGRP